MERTRYRSDAEDEDQMPLEKFCREDWMMDWTVEEGVESMVKRGDSVAGLMT